MVSILHKSALSKFLSAKRDVGRTFLIFGTRYDKFGVLKFGVFELTFVNGN